MDLATLLSRSRATAAFRADALRWADGEEAQRIRVVRPAPRVKVARVLCQLLHAHPELTLERVTVEGASGCADFIGVATAETAGGTYRFSFHWDCRWRAAQEGWLDWFGEPDQIRAAQEFGWRCFREWRVA